MFTYEPYSLGEVDGEVLAPVVSDRYFQVIDAATLRLERVR